MIKLVIVLGAGGHAKVVIDTLRLVNVLILGITDKNLNIKGGIWLKK